MEIQRGRLFVNKKTEITICRKTLNLVAKLSPFTASTFSTIKYAKFFLEISRNFQNQ